MKKLTLLFLLGLLLQFGLTLPLYADDPIIVGIYQNEPLVFTGSDGDVQGIYIDILEHVAAEEGWRIEYAPGSWPQNLERLERGEIDLLVGIAFSEERDERFDFTNETLLTNWGQVYTPKNAGMQSILDLEGKTIAVLKGDIYYAGLGSIVERFDIDCDFAPVDDYATVFERVDAGEVDAGLITRLYGLLHEKEYDVAQSPLICCPIELRFAVPEGKNQALTAALDRHLAALKGDKESVYYQSLNRWFGGISGAAPLLSEWLKWGLASAGGLLLFLLGGNILLRSQVRARTRALEGEIVERARAEEEIKQRSRELATLLEVSQALTATLDLNTVLQISINGAVDLMELDSGAIYLLEGETLYLGATTPPLPPQFPEEFRRAPLADHPHIRQAIATSRPVILPDTATANLTPAERAVSELRGLRSIVYAPLLAAERAVGVWILASVGESRAFSEAEIDLSRTLSTQAALAVENARLYEQVQRHAAELEQRVAERTAELDERLAEIEQLNRGMANLLEDLQAAIRNLERTAGKLQDANEELEAFAYSVSHDLRAPLRAIRGFAEIIARRHRPSLNEEGQHYFDNVVQASAHMDRLINDLLRYSRLGRRAVRRQPVSLGDLLAQAAASLADRVAETGAHLSLPDAPPVLHGDRTLLSQIFTNLLDNALIYHRPGAPPRVVVSCQAEPGADNVIISVADDGIGIAAEFHEKIFNVFQRLHDQDEYPGAGIGLAMVKKAVELMDGRVWVESALGEGSTFCVQLPVVSSQ